MKRQCEEFTLESESLKAHLPFSAEANETRPAALSATPSAMNDNNHDISTGGLRTAISGWLQKRLEPETFQELARFAERYGGDAEEWEIFSGFSSLPQKTGKNAFQPDKEEQEEAEMLRRGWRIGNWRIDQLGRALLLFELTERGKEEFLDKIRKIFISSDMEEAVAIGLNLPLLPWPEELQSIAAEGIRSNMTSVFESVALDNPYPADHLEEGAWNQMVLKALFVGSPLYRVIGLDRRSNPELTRMLLDYADERYSAGRSVSPELWRAVGPWLDGNRVDRVGHALKSEDRLQRQAALLTLRVSGFEIPEESRAEAGSLSNDPGAEWERIGRELESRSGKW